MGILRVSGKRARGSCFKSRYRLLRPYDDSADIVGKPRRAKATVAPRRRRRRISGSVRLGQGGVCPCKERRGQEPCSLDSLARAFGEGRGMMLLAATQTLPPPSPPLALCSPSGAMLASPSTSTAQISPPLR